MHVAVATPTFLPVVGGAELGIHEIYSRLGERHRVTVLTPRIHEKYLDAQGTEELRPAHYEVVRILRRPDTATPPAPLRRIRRSSAALLYELTRLHRSQRVDVLNLHFARPYGGSVRAISSVLGVPTALSLVGRSDVVHLLPPRERRRAEATMRASQAVIANSSYYLGSTPADQSLTIPFGVDTVAYSPTRRSPGLRTALGVGPEDFLLFTVQRLAPVKRVDALIRGVDELVRRNLGKRIVLVIAGKGPEAGRLEALLRERALESHVRIVGYVGEAELPAYFASADAFVFHSMLETFGVVFAQAMASGTPIVAANTSCVPDVVKPEQGILFPPFEVGRFADAVEALIDDEGLRRRLGDSGRSRAVNEFDWDAIAARYECELTRIASNAP